MPLIPEYVIDDIQHRADIAELIGRYMPLKRAGRHFKTHCPFHKEKTPSFMVNTDKQIFHCFGCGIGGNVFSFLMQHDRLTFPEAVRQLAQQVGVPVPSLAPDDSRGTSEQMGALLEKVCGYFERSLQSPRQGKVAREYLAQRGVSQQTCRAFRVGYARSGWDHLLTAARKGGITSEQLEAVGLVIRGKSDYYDRFRNRVIFPVLDARGKVRGFGGRSLDGQEPKYLNSPETALYTKGQHLFGLAQAKDAITAHKTAVIVEGYFDCVVLVEAGVAHVVAPLGTALTLEQARLLKRYAERVILAFDADVAGEQATLRGLDLLVESGLEVHVAQLPQGMDPDECVRAQGRERFERLLQGSISLFEFLVQSALRRSPIHDVESKVRAAQFVLPTIAKVPNAMLRSEYVRLLAERLDLDESAVTQELARIQPRMLASASHRTAVVPLAEGESRAACAGDGPERLLTALVLDEPERIHTVSERIGMEAVTDPTLRRILDVVAELQRHHATSQPAQVISRLSEAGYDAIVTALVELAESVSAKEKAFTECLRRLRANARRRDLAVLRERIRTAQQAAQDDVVNRLLVEYQQLVSEPQGG